MKVDVKFAESAESFKADFGEIKTASDGGYERGYADGYEAGYSKGSDTASLKKLIERTATEFSVPDDLERIGDCAFYSCSEIEITRLPDSVTSIGINAFMYCRKVNIAVMPKQLKSIGTNAFNGCYAMESVEIQGIVSLGNSSFQNCNKLTKIIIRATDGICSAGSNFLVNTPFANKTGYIYVPDNLVEDYKTAANWSIHASQIKPLSELEG